MLEVIVSEYAQFPVRLRLQVSYICRKYLSDKITAFKFVEDNLNSIRICYNLHVYAEVC